jgi:hypothetical protein
MAIHIRRRQFIVTLGSAAAWPLAARAQQSARMRRIGVLMNTVSDDAEGQARLAAFHQGLQQLGWTKKFATWFRLATGKFVASCFRLATLGCMRVVTVS